MKLVLTGGGTGGHVYPAIAIAEAFAGEAAFAPLDVLFVGTRDRMEAQIVPKAGLAIAFVHAAPLVRKWSAALVWGLVANVRGIVEALRVLRRARPDVLVATGGYVAFPVVVALRVVCLLGLSQARIAILETNVAAGLTNRLLAPLVDEVWYAIAPAGRALAKNEAVVGTPVRASLRRKLDRGLARRGLGLDADRTTVVVMGGSQGARSINEAVAGLLEAGVPDGWQIVVLAGAGEFGELRRRIGVRPRVNVLEYLDDPAPAYRAADIVVARAGASTLGELAATGTPALLVPYPFATRDHQTHNARAFATSGSARVVPDADLSPGRLRAELEDALAPGTLEAMRAAGRAVARTDAAATIVERVKRWPAANMAPP